MRAPAVGQSMTTRWDVPSNVVPSAGRMPGAATCSMPSCVTVTSRNAPPRESCTRTVAARAEVFSLASAEMASVPSPSPPPAPRRSQSAPAAADQAVFAETATRYVPPVGAAATDMGSTPTEYGVHFA